jgi:hypothetical protein
LAFEFGRLRAGYANGAVVGRRFGMQNVQATSGSLSRNQSQTPSRANRAVALLQARKSLQ